MKMLSL